MIVQIPEIEKEFIVKWKHRLPEPKRTGPFTKTKFTFPKEKGETECSIQCGGIYLISGFATCNRKDQYCKNIGRKISMRYALKYLMQIDERITKDIKRKFWEAYAEMRGGKF